MLVHVEVQGQPQAEFAERMYVYNYRLYDLHRQQVASLAVLADEQAGWRPSEFGYELWGCRAGLVFRRSSCWTTGRVVESGREPQSLRHDRDGASEGAGDAAQPDRAPDLEAGADPAAVRLGYNRQKVIDLFRFIDWVLQLPEPQALAFWHEVSEMEEEKRMQYVTSVERIGIQQGCSKAFSKAFSRAFSKARPRWCCGC